MNQNIIISHHLQTDLTRAIADCQPDYLFVLTDSTTREHCWTRIQNLEILKEAQLITIAPTDTHKDLRAVEQIWTALQNNHATRHSCLINLGGGMVTDIGGFAASTFKRGISFINIPTTLLAMVDASVGGKTGFNFNGLKNEIGVFNDANFVILNTCFLQTLDLENLRSGYAEMLKHGLLAHENRFAQLLSFNLEHPIDYQLLQQMVEDSVKIKEDIVRQDPHEKGLRKALNLGHTFGHAFESWSLKHTPVLHGYAVAYGLICELYLSALKCGFPTHKMHQLNQFIRENYGTLPITCHDYDALIQLMKHDKKNVGDTINFTLLENIGKVKTDQTATVEEIKEALDFLSEGN